MAAITGPISTLPGSVHNVPDNTMCDCHPNRLAVARIQGETDSMGSEMEDLCQECIDEQRAYFASDAGKAELTEARTGTCDWCKEGASDLGNMRNYDEGLHGPIYRVCGECRKNENERLAQYLDEDEW
jgi:hypothetical protein